MTTSLHALPPETLLGHAHWLRGLLRRLLDDEHAVEDAVQEAYLAALETPPRHPGAVRSWLLRAARNVAIRNDRRERRVRSWERAAARPEPVDSSAELVERVTRERDVVDAVLALDTPYRELLLLRYYEDRPPREIAASFGIPEATYWTRHRRALTSLRGKLAARYGSDAHWKQALSPLLTGLPSLATTNIALTQAAPLISLATGTIVMTSKTFFAVFTLAIALTVFLLLPTPESERTSTNDETTRLEDPKGLGTSQDPRNDEASRVARESLASRALEASPESTNPALAPQADATRVVGKLVGENGETLASTPVTLRRTPETRTPGGTFVIRTRDLPSALRGEVLGTTTTDDRGQFVFEELQGHGRLTLIVDHARYLSPEHELEAPEHETTDLGTVTLRLGAIVRGRVIDDLQQPIARCRMEARPTVEGGTFVRFGTLGDADLDDEAPTTTDAQGFFELGPLEPEIQLTLRADQPGTTTGTRALEPLRGGQVLEIEPIVLPSAVSLAGTVVDASGAPVADARIQTFRDGTNDLENFRPLLGEPARTDGQGKFAIRGLGEGSYKLVATSGAQRGTVRSPAGRLDLLVAFAAPGQIRGRVTTQGSGDPIEGATVELVPTGLLSLADLRLPPDATKTTDDEGRFHFENLERTAFVLRARAPGHAPLESETIDLSGERSTADVDLQLESGASLTFHVVDATTLAPIAGAQVRVSKPTAEPHLAPGPGRRMAIRASSGGGAVRMMTETDDPTETTDAKGEAVFRELEEGPARYTITHEDYAATVGELVVSRPGTQTQIVKLGRGGRVLGQAIDATNRPLARRDITIRRTDAPTPDVEVQTDERGAFQKARLAPGSYEASFADGTLHGAGGFVFRMDGQDDDEPRAPFQIAEGEETTVTLRDKARATLEVLVTSHGIPAPEGRVDVRRKEDAFGPLPTGLSNARPVDDNGIVRFAELDPGVWVISYGVATSLVEAETEVTLEPLAMQRIEVELPGARLAGTLIDADSGTPLSHADVRLRRATEGGTVRRTISVVAFRTADGGSTGSMGGILEGSKTSTDDRGRYVIDHVPAGRYVLEFTKKDYARTETDPFLVKADETQEGARHGITRGGGITGRILDAEGNPAPFTFVSAQRLDENGEDVGTPRSGMSQDGGLYTLESLVPGTYRVTANRPRIAAPGADPGGPSPAPVTRTIEVVAGDPIELELRFE